MADPFREQAEREVESLRAELAEAKEKHIAVSATLDNVRNDRYQLERAIRVHREAKRSTRTADQDDQVLHAALDEVLRRRRSRGGGTVGSEWVNR